MHNKVIGTYPTRSVKLARPRPLGAKLAEKHSTGREHLKNKNKSSLKNQEAKVYLNPVIPAVCHNYVSLIINGDPVGPRELPILCAFRSKKLGSDFIKYDSWNNE